MDEFKPLPSWLCILDFSASSSLSPAPPPPGPFAFGLAFTRLGESCGLACVQGLTLAHSRAQLEDLRERILTLELNWSTFRTHPRVNLTLVGDKVSFS